MAERKRLTGFSLMDAAFAADAKFVRLARNADSPTAFAAAVGVFWLLLADCRRAKSSIIHWEDYEEYDPQISMLQEVKLLNGAGFKEDTFAKWAPAYQSPFDLRRGTQGNAELHTGTQRDATYGEVGSIQSPSLPEGGVGETNGVHLDETQLDGYDFMCRLLGYAPNSEKFSHDVDDLEKQYGVERTVQAAQDAFRRSVEESVRLSPFELLKDTRTLLLTGKHRIAKQLTAQEAAAEAKRRRANEAAMLADIERQHAASMADAIAKAKEREARHD